MKSPSKKSAVKKLDISDLKALLLSEELKVYEREIVYNERYVREYENNKEKYRQACIKRGMPELFESKPPPITLLNHKYCPEPKLFGEKYPIIPIESRLPILAYGLIPHFCLALFLFFIALIDL